MGTFTVTVPSVVHAINLFEEKYEESKRQFNEMGAWLDDNNPNKPPRSRMTKTEIRAKMNKLFGEGEAYRHAAQILRDSAPYWK